VTAMGGRRRLHVRLKGLVQGVGFRHYARQLAESFGITGYVKNVPDGSVEVVAEGDTDVLNAFLDELKIGPRFASVSRVDVQWSEASDEYGDFNYRF